jgi:hypothetical protein
VLVETLRSDADRGGPLLAPPFDLTLHHWLSAGFLADAAAVFLALSRRRAESPAA